MVALVTTLRDRGAFREALVYARRLAGLNPSDSSIQQLIAQLEAAKQAELAGLPKTESPR